MHTYVSCLLFLGTLALPSNTAPIWGEDGWLRAQNPASTGKTGSLPSFCPSTPAIQGICEAMTFCVAN